MLLFPMITADEEGKCNEKVCCCLRVVLSRNGSERNGMSSFFGIILMQQWQLANFCAL